MFSGALLWEVQPSRAACETPNNVALDVNFPNYPFWKLVAEEMKQCGNVSVSFEFDAAGVEVDTLNPDRDLGSLVGVSNASLYRLNRQKLLQPLDELAKKYRVLIHPRQIIRLDGRVMAIAVTGNTKALAVHKDLFAQESVKIPETYDEMIQAAERLKGGPLYKFPLSMAFKDGWNLTQEFIDQFLAANGARLLDEGNRPAINNENGRAVLARMKQLAGVLPEDHLEAGPAKVLEDLLKFETPMATLWTSSAGPLENPAVSRVSGKMEILPAPAVNLGGKPAATLWWDGFAIPVNASPEEAEAAFLTALEGLDAEMLQSHRDNAFWLLQDYEPGRLAKNVLAAIDAGIPHYPASEATMLLRRALSPRLADFMNGKVQAGELLESAEADYLRAARERGIAGF
jgi:ABC-type glycerol-3-phosphate transport system substrate-binding protein